VLVDIDPRANPVLITKYESRVALGRHPREEAQSNPSSPAIDRQRKTLFQSKRFNQQNSSVHVDGEPTIRRLNQKSTSSEQHCPQFLNQLLADLFAVGQPNFYC
jgi:hypothetical protein